MNLSNENYSVKQKLFSLSSFFGMDFYVSYRFPNLSWVKWKKLSEWNFSIEPNYRQVLPSELVLETDFSREENEAIAKEIISILKKKGISFFCAFSGNKSYHFHIFWSNLAELGDFQRTKAKHLLIDWLLGPELAPKIDKSNLGKKHLILINGARHPKTGMAKTIYALNETCELNVLPLEILAEAERSKELEFEQTIRCAPLSCPFIEYACYNSLPISNRNSNLVPNLVAVTPQIAVWQRCADIQGKRLIEFENWAKRKPNFNCKQLQNYAGTIGKRSICDLCLLNRGGN